ncbi:zinc ribbon domain-containing protein YjdM [Daejeonella oryzae]|uniref:zinc ribbon domain-containing protein YjdM n=1 Tax=Daejeonella oryzae TaxID=1122943 RepID=UPI00041C7116|nr:zinc ribbon domain-containing protein YjdM [Daejeonella oryzae]
MPDICKKNIRNGNKIDMMEEMIVKDSNGTILNEGDSVLLIKSLKVKGSAVTLKKGTLIKKIRLTSDSEEVDCKVENMSVVLKTCFLKKK